MLLIMRTTVDLDEALLERAKRLALSEGKTLGSVVSEALASYLAKRKSKASDPPFELIVRGNPQGRFPSASELAAIDEEEEFSALNIPASRRRASP
jgi:hypothetical protein